jgi:hypothetical protein
MPPWKWDNEMGLGCLMPVLVSLATVFVQEPEDESTRRCCPLLRHIDLSNEPTPGPMNYREAVWTFCSSSGTSVSLVAPYEGQKMKATTKSDARDPVDKPTAAATRKREPKPPKVTREPGLSDAPVSYFAEPIFTSSGKIAAAVTPVVGKAPPPNDLVSIAYKMLGKAAPPVVQPKMDVDANVQVTSEIWFECNERSVSQHLKCRRAERKACIAAAHMMDMALLEQSIGANAEALWLVVIRMISRALLSAATGIFNACMQRKWLARAVVIWMLVETTTASPIVAASVSSPAPMRVAKFHSLQTPAAGHRHRRLLSKVIVSNWAEMKAKCEAGGNEVTLALGSSFDGREYPGEIDFSGKTCVVIGQGQILDAKGAGRFFIGKRAGSSLEVHGLILKNGNAVSGCVLVSTISLKLICSNTCKPHGTIFERLLHP